MMCRRSMMLLVIHILLLTTTAHAIVSYQTYRVDCESLCKKIQKFSGSCPTFGSCQWYCQEKQTNCPPGTRYHCARDLNVEETFVVACAKETFCRAGEEPRISLDRASSNVDASMASVFCRPCFKRERFHSRFNTSTATFSECPSVKLNLCTEQIHKIDCGYVSYRELTKSDGYCRCDARKGYAAQSEEMCFYENKRCFKKKCLESEELLLNYSCAKECPAGFARPKTSDNCLHMKTLPPETTSFITTTVEDQETYLSTEMPFYPPRLKKIYVLIATIATLIITATLFLIICKHKKVCHLESEEATSKVVSTTAGTHDLQGAVELRDTASPTATTTTKTHDTKVKMQNTTAEQGLSESQTTEYPGQDWRNIFSNLNKSMNKKNKIDCKSCLKLISEQCCSECDELQNLKVIEPLSCQTLHAMDVSGFEEYTIKGQEITDLFALFSHLVCGNEDLKDTLRFAAARFAIQHFETYVKQLMEKCKKSKTPLIDAYIFFEIHGICVKEFKFPLEETCVSLALDTLVHGIIGRRRTGPFHAELLSGALNCTINQHFENNRYYDRDIRTIPGLKETVSNSSSRTRELHIYWKRSTNYINSYCIVPLFQVDDKTSAKNTNISQLPKCETDKATVKCMTKLEPYKWRKDFIKFESKQSAVFDKLKDVEFTKPECVVRTIDVPGYKGYEKPGDENTSVYEWISYLLCENQSLTYTLRLAAARYAMLHFETYVAKLTDTFTDSNAAKTFFAAHDIRVEETKNWLKQKRECVSDEFGKLVRETVNEGKGNAPFYIEFLSGALNLKITQHFQENKYSGRKVNTIAGLDVTLSTESFGAREMHMYWMRSRRDDPTCRIVPLFKCVPRSIGMELCEDVYSLLMNQKVFDAESCLNMIHNKDIYAYEQLKGLAIIKPDPNVLRIIKRIKVKGHTAYEKPGHETTCLYELMSYLLFGNAEMKYIMRLAAIRYALQNAEKYVNKLTSEFEDTSLNGNNVNNTKFFFEIHNIEFKESKQSLMGNDVWMAFADLLRETVNTGQGPFYVDFLRGALNCKIYQYIEKGFYDRDVLKIRGLSVKLKISTPPERELHIYRMKTGKGRSSTYTIVPLFKSDA